MVASKIERTPGPFWQDCAGGCGDKAQANLTPKGKPVLCAFCADQRGVERLEQPTPAEKQAFIAKPKVERKAPKPRQVARAQRKAEGKAIRGARKAS